MSTLCNPVDCSQVPLSVRFPRQEYWTRLPFPPPGHLPDPGIEPTAPVLAGRFFTTESLGFTHFLLLMDGITGVDEHLVTLRRRTSSPREVRFRLPAPVSSQHLNTDGPAGWRGAAGGRVLATVGTRTPWGPAPRPGRCPQETYRPCSAPAALSSASGTGSGWGSIQPGDTRVPPAQRESVLSGKGPAPGRHH